MLMAIVYIGMAQCLFSALLVFSKRPLGIADKILGFWLLASSLLFIYLFLKKIYNIEGYVWPISLGLIIAFPEFLVLYSKYITTERKKFNKRDLLYFTPFCIVLCIIFLYYIIEPTNSPLYNIEYSYAIWPLTALEYLFYVTLWSYSIIAIYYVIQYKKQINQSYAFDSHRINLSWLLIVIVGYFITYNLLMLIIKTYFEKLDYEELLVFINGAQLISDKKSVVLSKFVIKEADSNTYQKSGLKEITKVEENLKKLINCMNTFEPWKDNELSVTKLSELTGIPKHYITQILNDNLQKNFYTFINEYRTEYAKKLIISPKYSHWSIVSIAYESGFNSKAAFNNFFKKYTGMTPSQYKESNSNKS
jgi:AraC-like DNA-binding protein